MVVLIYTLNSVISFGACGDWYCDAKKCLISQNLYWLVANTEMIRLCVVICFDIYSNERTAYIGFVSNYPQTSR